MKTIFIGFLTLFWAGFGLATFHAAEPTGHQRSTNQLSITTGPILQIPTDHSITVTWITDRNATGVVEYGPANGEVKTAFTSRHGLIDANERVHSVELRDLQPGMVYRYRALSKEIVNLRHWKVEYGAAVASEYREFKLPDPRKKDMSFIVFNDIHDQAATIRELLKVAGRRPYDFVVLNGDIVSYIENEGQISAILNQAAAEFAQTVPLVWVRGNHETRGRFARYFPDYVTSPKGGYYFSFTHGPVHFIVLDTGEDKVDDHQEYGGLADFYRYREEQGEWLKAEVKTRAFRNAQYRIVLCHMPFASERAAKPKPSSEAAVFTGMAHAYAQFGRTLDRAGIDLMISGHMHFPAVIPPEVKCHKYPILQGGGDKGTNRTVIRVDVSKTGLDAVIMRPDGSRFASCHLPARR
jgi:predicted phosphodiesterase